MSFIKVDNLTVKFPLKKQEYLTAVNSVSFGIEKGEIFALVGESGSGKTTTGKAILNLVKVSSGHVYLENEEITGKESKSIRKRMQIIFQDPYSTLNPHKTIRRILEEPLKLHKIAYGDQLQTKLKDMLCQVGLCEDILDKYPHEFSGGQLQRICIARALLLNPEFLVCDESIASLDVSIQAQIINLLKELQKEYCLTMLFISHNMSVLRYICNSIGVMYLGCLVEKSEGEELFNNPLHPYTRALLSVVPSPDPHFEDSRSKTILKGEIPSPINPPKGCPFSTRCSFAIEKCYEEKPLLKEVRQGHFCACHIVGGEEE